MLAKYGKINSDALDLNEFVASFKVLFKDKFLFDEEKYLYQTK